MLLITTPSPNLIHSSFLLTPIHNTLPPDNYLHPTPYCVLPGPQCPPVEGDDIYMIVMNSPRGGSVQLDFEWDILRVIREYIMWLRVTDWVT